MTPEVIGSVFVVLTGTEGDVLRPSDVLVGGGSVTELRVIVVPLLAAADVDAVARLGEDGAPVGGPELDSTKDPPGVSGDEVVGPLDAVEVHPATASAVTMSNCAGHGIRRPRRNRV